MLRPGGLLFVTMPNLVWRWSVWLAEASGVRKFGGIENWLPRSGLWRAMAHADWGILGTDGLHILPFQLRPLLPIIRIVNEQGERLEPVTINQCWIARKRGGTA